MPDEHGKLTAEDAEKVRHWWQLHWKPPVVCPVCKTDQWQAGDYVVKIDRNAVDVNVVGTSAYMMLPIMCAKCSHTIFFNAVAIGIVPPYDPKLDPTALPAPNAKVGTDG